MIYTRLHLKSSQHSNSKVAYRVRGELLLKLL